LTGALRRHEHAGMRRPRDPKTEAAAWFERLGHPVTTADLREFACWRDDPTNDAAYQAVEREGLRLRGRFLAIPDPAGFSVIDSWTGEPATFANAQHTGISKEDAGDLCDLLNRRAADAGRPRRQN
jgi:hypothetical protein